MYYCDKACQKADWKGRHKHECSSADFAQSDPLERLFNRSSLAVKDKTLLNQKFYFRSDQDEECKSFTLKDLCSKTPFLGTIVLRMPPELVQRHSRPILNNFCSVIGFGLYVAEACSTGYSCAPNAAPCFDGTRAYLRAMTDLRGGQRITTGMHLYLMPKLERREYFLNNAGIDCHCELCEEDEVENGESSLGLLNSCVHIYFSFQTPIQKIMLV